MPVFQPYLVTIHALVILSASDDSRDLRIAARHLTKCSKANQIPPLAPVPSVGMTGEGKKGMPGTSRSEQVTSCAPDWVICKVNLYF